MNARVARHKASSFFMGYNKKARHLEAAVASPGHNSLTVNSVVRLFT